MSVDVTVDLALYPLEAVMGTAYVFVDRCYVFLDKPAEGKVLVSLTGKTGSSEDELRDVAGEFQNELLSQALRHQIGQRHERLRELLMARALFGAAPRLEEDVAVGADGTLAPAGTPGDGTAALDGASLPAESDEYLDDPLGIAIPWEEKFAKATAPAAPGPAADVAAAAAELPRPADAVTTGGDKDKSS